MYGGNFSAKTSQKTKASWKNRERDRDKTDRIFLSDILQGSESLVLTGEQCDAGQGHWSHYFLKYLYQI